MHSNGHAGSLCMLRRYIGSIFALVISRPHNILFTDLCTYYFRTCAKRTSPPDSPTSPSPYHPTTSGGDRVQPWCSLTRAYPHIRRHRDVKISQTCGGGDRVQVWCSLTRAWINSLISLVAFQGAWCAYKSVRDEESKIMSTVQ